MSQHYELKKTTKLVYYSKYYHKSVKILPHLNNDDNNNKECFKMIWKAKNRSYEGDDLYDWTDVKNKLRWAAATLLANWLAFDLNSRWPFVRWRLTCHPAVTNGISMTNIIQSLFHSIRTNNQTISSTTKIQTPNESNT